MILAIGGAKDNRGVGWAASLLDGVEASLAEYASPLFGGILPVIGVGRRFARSVGADRVGRHHGLLEQTLLTHRRGNEAA